MISAKPAFLCPHALSAPDGAAKSGRRPLGLAAAPTHHFPKAAQGAYANSRHPHDLAGVRVFYSERMDEWKAHKKNVHSALSGLPCASNGFWLRLWSIHVGLTRRKQSLGRSLSARNHNRWIPFQFRTLRLGVLDCREVLRETELNKVRLWRYGDKCFQCCHYHVQLSKLRSLHMRAGFFVFHILDIEFAHCGSPSGWSLSLEHTEMTMNRMMPQAWPRPAALAVLFYGSSRCRGFAAALLPRWLSHVTQTDARETVRDGRLPLRLCRGEENMNLVAKSEECSGLQNGPVHVDAESRRWSRGMKRVDRLRSFSSWRRHGVAKVQSAGGLRAFFQSRPAVRPLRGVRGLRRRWPEMSAFPVLRSLVAGPAAAGLVVMRAKPPP